MVDTLTKQYRVTAEIPIAFIRYLATRTDERILEVVLVYNGVDRWDTIIDPEGMRTAHSVVTVDYNHNDFDTGAYLRNTRIAENYELEDGTVLDKVLIGDIHIPKDSEMFHRNRNGEKVTAGNLHAAVTKGQVRSVSVEFKPYKGKQITDIKTGVTTFREWDLLRLSLLDVTPGQPYSGIKIVRSIINNPNMLEQIKQALAEGKITEDELKSLIVPEDTKEVPAEPTEAPEEKPQEDRDVIIDKTDETSPDSPATPATDESAPEGDTPEEDDIRGYITKIEERLAKLEGLMTERAQTEKTNADEEEATRIRALNTDLKLPTKVKTEARAIKPLGEDTTPKGAKRFTAFDMEAQITKAKLAQLQ
jgi:hypothetical protein